jgi:hypothetical protein
LCPHGQVIELQLSPSPVFFLYMQCRGEDKFFKTLAKLASSVVFSLAKSENNWPQI